MIASIELVPWGLLLIFIGLYAACVLALIAGGRRTHARALAGFIPDCVRMIRRLLRDPATTRAEWIVLVLVLAYLLSPLDLVPDFIPVAGQLDDAIVVALVVGWLVSRRGRDAIQAAWPGPERSLRIVLAAAARRRPEDGPDYPLGSDDPRTGPGRRAHRDEGGRA